LVVLGTAVSLKVKVSINRKMQLIVGRTQRVGSPGEATEAWLLWRESNSRCLPLQVQRGCFYEISAFIVYR